MSALRVIAGCAACSLMCAALLAAQSPSSAQPAAGHPVAVADQPAQPSLYKRLGGYDGIAAFADDFIFRLATDKKLSRFFVGLNDTSKKRVRQHVVDFLCEQTGGPCVYLGQDMKTAHQGLNITEADWDAMVVDLKQSFDHFNLGQEERSELMAALTKLKPDIVQAK